MPSTCLMKAGSSRQIVGATDAPATALFITARLRTNRRRESPLRRE